VKIRWIVVGAFALGVPTVGLTQTVALLVLAACLVPFVALAHAFATKKPEAPGLRDSYLLRRAGIDPEGPLPADWERIAQDQWEIAHEAYELAARLRFPGNRQKQAAFVGACWLRSDIWQLQSRDIHNRNAQIKHQTGTGPDLHSPNGY
jgi:hypothetical protein